MELETTLLMEKVFREQEKKIVSFLTKVLGDADAARDIAQSAFLRTWEYSEIETIENLKGFIFKTASNLAKNEIRRRVRFRKTYSHESEYAKGDAEQEFESSHPTPEHSASLREDVYLITKTINNLPKKARRAFILSRFEGLSYQQISTLLGVSESSVEKYMMTALKQLRSALDDVEPAGATDPIQKHISNAGRDQSLASSLLAELSI